MDPSVIISGAAVVSLFVAVIAAVIAWRSVEASRASALDPKRSAGAAERSAAAVEEQLRLSQVPRFRARLERVPRLSGFGQRLWVTLDGPDPVTDATIQIVGGSSLLPGLGGNEQGILFDPPRETLTIEQFELGEPVALPVYAGEDVPAGVRLKVTTVTASRPVVMLVPVDVPQFRPDDYFTAYDA